MDDFNKWKLWIELAVNKDVHGDTVKLFDKYQELHQQHEHDRQQIQRLTAELDKYRRNK